MVIVVESVELTKGDSLFRSSETVLKRGKIEKVPRKRSTRRAMDHMTIVIGCRIETH